MLIVGGGIIGLEMGTVYSTLGARLDVVEMMDGLMQGADRDLVKVWEKVNKHRFDRIMLKTKTVGAKATPEGIQVQFEGLDGSKSEGTYDLVLQAVGRTPNGKKIAADKAGVAVTERGFVNVDIQMRTSVPQTTPAPKPVSRCSAWSLKPPSHWASPSAADCRRCIQ
jgi:dihydrolipoamide dehydrogenase